MAQRNPLNDRYRGEGPSGKTRRSASSARLKRPSSGPRSATPSGKLSARDQARLRRENATAQRRADAALRREVAAVVPTDPAYRTWRIAWWALIIVGLVCVTAIWVLRSQLMGPSPDDQNVERMLPVGWVVLIGSYLAIGAALLIDFFKIRPLRRIAQDAARADKMRAAKKN